MTTPIDGTLPHYDLADLLGVALASLDSPAASLVGVGWPFCTVPLGNAWAIKQSLSNRSWRIDKPPGVLRATPYLLDHELKATASQSRRRRPTASAFFRPLRPKLKEAIEPYLDPGAFFYEVILTRRGALVLKVGPHKKSEGDAGIRNLKGAGLAARLAWDNLTGHERIEFIQDANSLQEILKESSLIPAMAKIKPNAPATVAGRSVRNP